MSYRCFHRMSYSFYHYNHLGLFRCEHCGYRSHEPDFLGSGVDFAARRLLINGVPVEVTYNTTFNMFNTVAAAAVCCSASGMSLEQFARGAKSFHVAKERLDSFAFDGRKTVLMMTKQNAASLDQSISYVLEQEGEKTVVLYINNVLYLEYKDISWLYDVASWGEAAPESPRFSTCWPGWKARQTAFWRSTANRSASCPSENASSSGAIASALCFRVTTSCRSTRRWKMWRCR